MIISTPKPFRQLTQRERARLSFAWTWAEAHGLPFDVTAESSYRFAFSEINPSLIIGLVETREFDGVLWVQLIYVPEHGRRRGVGSELLHNCMLEARMRGLRLGLCTHSVNTPMRLLAEKLGLKSKERMMEYWTPDRA